MGIKSESAVCKKSALLVGGCGEVEENPGLSLWFLKNKFLKYRYYKNKGSKITCWLFVNQKHYDILQAIILIMQ